MGDPSGIFLQRYDASGSPIGGETRVNANITGGQQLPSVGIDGENKFVVVWSGFGNGDSRGIFLKRFDASGNPIGAGESCVPALLPISEKAEMTLPARSEWTPHSTTFCATILWSSNTELPAA